MNTKSSRKHLKFDRNPIEAIRDSGVNIATAVKDATTDEFEKSVSLAWKQLLGTTGETTSQNEQKSVKEDSAGSKQMQDLQEGEEVIFSKKEKKAEIAPAIDYVAEILHSERRISSENNRELNTKIEELRIEISKLAKSSKQLEVLVKDVSIERIGPNPGKYHLNFFEWVLASIQIARIRVEESTNWLASVSTKSQKRGYWNSVKKHGTSFMLSGERVVAQQTG